jgi:tRNA dimethylallyltransferase
MIDIVDPSERFSAFEFARQAENIIRDLAARGKGVLLCGGTGLYFQALCKGLAPTISEDPELRRTYQEMADKHGLFAVYGELEKVDPVSAASSHPSNLVRNIRALEVFAATGKPLSELKALAAGPGDMVFDVMTLIPDRQILYPRINARVDAMMSRGLLDEFKGLLQRGYNRTSPGLTSVGYREFFAFENGLSSLDQTIAAVKQNSRHYAKRQITWFRRQVEGYSIAPAPNAADEITRKVESFLQGH